MNGFLKRRSWYKLLGSSSETRSFALPRHCIRYSFREFELHSSFCVPNDVFRILLDTKLIVYPQALKDRFPDWIVNQRRVKKIVRNFSGCKGETTNEEAHSGWDEETHEYWDKSSWTLVADEEREEEEEEEGFVIVHRVTV